jgi:hypothetical protein
MEISNQEQLGLGQHVDEEGFHRHLGDELARGENMRVHLTSEHGLRRMKQLHRLAEAEVTDQHHVDVAAAVSRACATEPKTNAARSL